MNGGGLSFGSSSKKSTTNSNSQTDPWEQTIPYLEDFLGEMGAAGGRGLSPDQMAAFGALKGNAAEGNPWTGKIAGLADRAFDAADYSGGVTKGLETLEGTLGDIARGKYLDPMANPQMRAMLDQVGGDVMNRINAMFAGAGRDLSGANQMAVGKGVTAAQLPLLLDQYNRERVAQSDAARTIAGAQTDSSGRLAGLDAQRLDQQSKGIGLGKAALDARDEAANKIINIDQQIKQLPLQDLGLLASILFPAAGLGAQEQGTSTTKSKGSSAGISLPFPSDRRVKRDVFRIGTLAGLPIYLWRYLWSDVFHMGPMAQDVRARFPHAVVTLPGGVLAIDYDALVKGA